MARRTPPSPSSNLATTAVPDLAEWERVAVLFRGIFPKHEPFRSVSHTQMGGVFFSNKEAKEIRKT